ncbi:uncharacterized protein O3C94_003475 [Discoglossus pictus]
MLAIPNTSHHIPATFILIGIPGLDEGSIWISVSFFFIYILSIFGNFSILYIIKTEQSLHGPMYFFLSMLALNDIAFPSSTVPKMLGIFWLNALQIDAVSCLTQMFFVHSLSVVETGILAAMAYDRFIAICFPLRYTTLLNYTVLEKIAIIIVIRAIVSILPIPILVGRLQYCTANIISHSYCEHMAVVNVACGDTHINSMYGLILSLSITGFDLLFIGLSYVKILQAVYKLPSKEARHKAVGTCGSHITVIIITYLPGIFSFVTYRFGQKTVPLNVHIFLANIYILYPAFLNPLIYGVKTKQIRQRVIKCHDLGGLHYGKTDEEVQKNPGSKVVLMSQWSRKVRSGSREIIAVGSWEDVRANKSLGSSVYQETGAGDPLKMLPLNNTHPLAFILVGIPGLEPIQCWLSIPFCCMYIVAFIGNCAILFIIKHEKSLHEPMYFFVSMLSLTDLVLSSSTLPKMLSIFWFNFREIRFEACLTQMFFIHSFTAMESGFFLAMALDRYVAICNPLRHPSILNNTTVLVIGLSVVTRALVFFSPHPFIVKTLVFCEGNIILHTYCEFMAVIKLSCGESSVSKAYSLTVASLIGAFDLLSTAVSYAFILRTAIRLPTKEAGFKALSTCTSHICVILVFYSTAVFTFLTHRFGHNVAPQIHISISTIYLLVPPMLNPIIYGLRTKKIRQRMVSIVYFTRS